MMVRAEGPCAAGASAPPPALPACPIPIQRQLRRSTWWRHTPDVVDGTQRCARSRWRSFAPAIWIRWH